MKTTKKKALKITENGWVWLSLARVEGGRFAKVKKVTDSGRIYLKDDDRITFLTPSNDGEMFKAKGYFAHKVDEEQAKSLEFKNRLNKVKKEKGIEWDDPVDVELEDEIYEEVQQEFLA